MGEFTDSGRLFTSLPDLRDPLNACTLRHILHQCKSAKAVRKVINREIGKVRNSYDWGFLSQAEAVSKLDVIRGVLL